MAEDDCASIMLQNFISLTRRGHTRSYERLHSEPTKRTSTELRRPRSRHASRSRTEPITPPRTMAGASPREVSPSVTTLSLTQRQPARTRRWRSRSDADPQRGLVLCRMTGSGGRMTGRGGRMTGRGRRMTGRGPLTTGQGRMTGQGRRHRAARRWGRRSAVATSAPFSSQRDVARPSVPGRGATGPDRSRALAPARSHPRRLQRATSTPASR